MEHANTESVAVRVDVEALEDYLTALFARTGLTAEDARFLASCLVQTSLWGKGSHGVMRVPHYVQRLESGAINPRPKTAIVRGGEAFEIMDGDNGPAFLVGRDAMLGALTLARTHHIGAVGVVESTHFGAAALYARLGVDHAWSASR